MIIASFYPSPFDSYEAHESNSTIIAKGKIYSYEEAKLTTVKLDSTIKFPERSFFLGCKELKITPSMVNKWVFPKSKKKIGDTDLINFFAYFKINFINISAFKKWKNRNVVFIEHHLMHAGLAIFGSKFKKCAFVTADGGGDSGDHYNFKFGEYNGKKLFIAANYKGYESLASFHGWVADAMGMNGGENGKVSGLAAYGTIKGDLKKKFNRILPIKKLNVGFIRKRFSKSKINLNKIDPQEYDRAKFINSFPSDTNIFRITRKYLPQDIGATAEKIVQDKFIEILKKLKRKTRYDQIVFAGGLFNNVSLNNKIIESKIFKDVYFTPAPGDCGLSLGGALLLWNKKAKNKRLSVLNPYLGPSFNDKEIENLIKKFNLKYQKITNINKKAASLICKNKIIGYFQGRGEIGPRSLGARSILANPANKLSKAIINQHLKKRDWYMPYAPSINIEHVKDFTTAKYRCRYMQVAYKIEKGFKKIKSAIHIDNSSRIHCVDKKYNPKFWGLINEIKKINGTAAVLNTSFNRHGISTISSPRQAIEHLLAGCMDYLIISNYLVSLNENRKLKKNKYKIHTENKELYDLCLRRFIKVKKYLKSSEAKIYKEYLKKLKK
tara:strand:+ start:2689 stop:4515 length:1827 start_codon:yes stop_codon:yes gene_type:complete